MKDFTKTISQDILNIEDKSRSNLFSWRGQFSPQLIESLLQAYCPPKSVVLDPFAGSGTVLLEAACMGLPAFGFEINPAAWSFSKLYEFANASVDLREQAILDLRAKIEEEFPIVLFSKTVLPPDEIRQRLIHISESIEEKTKIICNALFVLLDIYNNRIDSGFIQSKFYGLAELIRALPHSSAPIKADLQDARCLPLENQSVDFVVTSPPYINVLNYHQNYRRSVELLGWDVLRVARSEIGSNRANRGNRFLTVIQYCIDMAHALQELGRILEPGGRVILIVGYESNVLGVSFKNADIVERIVGNLGLFALVLRQKRAFTNRFGKKIREDILNLSRENCNYETRTASNVGRNVALAALESKINAVPPKNKEALEQAVSRCRNIDGTPLFDSGSYDHYQTRECVMMVNEKEKNYSHGE